MEEGLRAFNLLHRYSGSVTVQPRVRKEGLRAFFLLTAVPPDLGGRDLTVKPVQVLGWSWFCSLLFFLASCSCCKQADQLVCIKALLKVHNLVNS